MPELPEVETVVRGLRILLPGRRIVAVRFGKTDFVDDPGSLENVLPGQRITAIERLGKFIRIVLAPPDAEIDSAEAQGPMHLMVHLGMTGRVAVRPVAEPHPPHTHGFFELDDGRELRYTDPRRFGRIALILDGQLAAFSAKLGQDPLDISEGDFVRRFAGRRARIKSLLLDQSVLCGVGNIYADESLFRAGIHPMRHAADLSEAELAGLRLALRRVLLSAIRLGGSSISDFVDAAGLPGEFQLRHRVYQRHGKACFHCGATIRRAVVAGRGSHFCPRCQPARAARPAKAKKASRARRSGAGSSSMLRALHEPARRRVGRQAARRLRDKPARVGRKRAGRE